MARRFGLSAALSVNEQLARMRIAYPHFRCGVRRDSGTLVAEGEIRPTPRSMAYRVRIEYHAGDPPRVQVLSPPLRPREEGGGLPHVYPGNRLCLYLPGTGEWSPELSLAHTVVPWVSEWLFFYETWRALGVWLGGGVEPTERKTIRREEKDKPYESERS